MKRSTHAIARQRSVPLSAIIVGLLAVACGAIILFGLTSCGPKQVEVPDLAMMESADAEKALTDAGLKLGKVAEKADPEMKLGGFVLEQSVKAGEKADEGSAVDIVVSSGPKMNDPVKVPDLKGMTVEEAEKALADVLLIPQPGEAKYSDKVDPGKICAQSPKAGKEAKVLDTITYNISLGKETVAVPNVVGKSKDDASKAIEDAGLSVDSTESYSDDVDEGVVISQDVKADEKIEKGSTVTIEVSLGEKPPEQVAVPDIVSYNLAAAKSTLESAGLEWEWTGDEDGTVTAIDPVPGTKVDKGTKITFELKAPEKKSDESSDKDDSNDEGDDEEDGIEVPDVVGMDAEAAAFEIEEAGLSVDGDNDGNVIKQSPEAGEVVDEGDTVSLRTDAGELDNVDPEQVVWAEGLGQFETAEKVQEDNGKWYWEVVTKDINGKDHTFLVNKDGKYKEKK